MLSKEADVKEVVHDQFSNERSVHNNGAAEAAPNRLLSANNHSDRDGWSD